MTGVSVDVDTRVSAIVCPSSSRDALTARGLASRGPPHPPAAATHVAPAHRCACAHGRRSRFQLHSRPPRQRLPSSLVIESASALPSRPASASCAEALPMNASDHSGVIVQRRIDSRPPSASGGPSSRDAANYASPSAGAQPRARIHVSSSSASNSPRAAARKVERADGASNIQATPGLSQDRQQRLQERMMADVQRVPRRSGATSCKVPRQAWHRRQGRHHRFCKLQLVFFLFYLLVLRCPPRLSRRWRAT
jgi:hypothetical protein